MDIAIIKYNAGNTLSVQFALERMGASPIVTDNKELILKADKVIFPGVGEASTAMQYLKEQGLEKLIPSLKQPVLGICLGMQLMCNFSEENNTACMGIFNVPVKKFASGTPLKVPQTGWNTITDLASGLFKDISNNAFVYLVHSYYVPLSEYTVAQTDYGVQYSAAIAKDNFMGVQFHPEKSAATGEQLLRNFLNIEV